jgi:cupin 2 domain-containing protein
VRRGNLFDAAATPSTSERFDTLLDRPGWRLERIVSTGQATAPGQWLEQERDEWVLLLSGSALLRFEAEREPISLRPGDWVLIPGKTRHRVEETDQAQPTVWLALHYER